MDVITNPWSTLWFSSSQLCFAVVILSSLRNSYVSFTYNLQDFYTGTGTIMYLPRRQCNRGDTSKTLIPNNAWWRHQRETFSALLAICAGNSPVSGEFPAQRTVTRSFDVFFDVRLIKRLSKHSRGWWFETLSHPLWRHRNGQNITKHTQFAHSLGYPATPKIHECCAINRYQGQGRVINSHSICGMSLLVPALDTCLWHNTPELSFIHSLISRHLI